ncbi:MAG: ATP-binding protein [Sporichthyaceae bacterium]
MERVANPFRPGFNQAPAELAGRELVLAAAREAFDVAALDGRTPRPLLLVGTRGVGKTVALGEIAALAAELHSWPTAAVEVRLDGRFLDRLLSRLAAVVQLFDQAPASRKFKLTSATVRAGALGIGGEVTVEPAGTAGPAGFDTVLRSACEAAIRRGGGLVIALDELQLAHRDELGEFAAALQEHVADAWPLVVVAAGLPSLREPRRSVTYLERGEWHELGLLDPSAALRALTKPAEQAGRPFVAAGAALLAGASGGYPFAIQVLGHYAWRASSGAKRIAADHAARAVEAANADLAAGLYAARWSDASPNERKYLGAVADLIAAGETPDGAAVARALGRRTTEVSYLRDRLLKKGTLFAVGRELRFLVPGMAEWILNAD